LATFQDLRKGFRIGPWDVLPDLGVLRQGDVEEHIEPMVMDVLVLLASGDGGVVTTDQIVDVVWRGRPTAPEAIVQKIKVLRDKLGDNPRDPQYIQTHPKIGYRIVCPVVIPEEEEKSESGAAVFPAYLWPMVGGLLAIIVIAIVVLSNRPGDLPGNSVAVCQFENMGSEADAPLVYGIRQQLLSSLSRVRNLRVVKPSCETEDVPGLGVKWVVTGSVLRGRGRVRITPQLLASNGDIEWSEIIDGSAEEVEELFNLQERVADLVIKAISGELDVDMISTRHPATLNAYQLYLLGDYAFSKRSEPELERAVDFFREAIDVDPAYGPAYLGLANSYVLLADYPDMDRDSMYEEAIETAKRGAELDVEIQDAVGTVYGFIYTKDFKWTEAAEAFETAINSSIVSPTSYQTSSHHWYSRFLANVGLLEKSLEHATLAHAMDTASPILNARLAVAYHWLNDSENADKYYSRAADKEVGSWIHNLAYTLFLIREERLDEARTKAKEALESYGQATDWVDPVFNGLMNPSDAASMADTIDSISAAAANGDLPLNIELTLWALLGQGDRAMEAAWALERSGEYFEVEILYLDEFRVLREQEGFPELLEALGLAEYWDSIGCHWDGDQVVCSESAGT
jgi:DNA-binding winged helix-turn-helix (wHTH) protein/TolB-like protein/Tfp pilus assembly protein PilF